MQIHTAQPDHFEALLALNQASVHFLSPLDRTRLSTLHAQATYHRVALAGDRVAGFLLAFAAGADYDSPNYLWFEQRYQRYLYIDRIVIDQAFRGQGLGRQLYQDLFRFAAEQGFERVTCEYDIEPPNPVSAGFHRRFGFSEVGSRTLGAGGKRVSMQCAAVVR